MNRSVFHLFVFGALICTSGQLRADLTDLVPTVHAEVDPEEPKKPAEQSAPAKKEESSKTPVKPADPKPEPKNSVRFSGIKSAANKIVSIPTGAILAVASTLKTQMFAHPYVAATTATVLAAAAVYVIVFKATETKKSTRVARR